MLIIFTYLVIVGFLLSENDSTTYINDDYGTNETVSLVLLTNK